MLKCIPGILACLMTTCLWAEENPRQIDLGNELSEIRTLEQNWSDQEASWFYDVPQGSRLLPYNWFLHLEQADNPKPFRDADHIRAMGYIPRKAAPQNPDGLPIGFVKDIADEDGTAELGFTCAACHTAQINYQGTALLIDGAPAMGDLERFLKSLTAALYATAANEEKFQRFAAGVLPDDANDNQKGDLRNIIHLLAERREAYNKRNLPAQKRDQFGPGRVDAFGAIFNEVAVRFLEVPENVHAANAPVSFPCLWDAPQHDHVQWNGAAENRTSPLGQLLFGTSEVGALGRNAGEVLGVFGNMDINEYELLVPRRYSSSVNAPNLIKIEDSLKTLWSPQWPGSVFGEIDDESRQRGQVLYEANCLRCHREINRMADDRKVMAQLSDVGTDQQVISNFTREAKTGKLKGRRATLLGGDRLAETEPIGVILKHVVERVILEPKFNFLQLQQAIARNAKLPNRLEAIDTLNPGFKMTATIDLGDQKLVGQFDSLESMKNALEISGGQFRLQPSGQKGAVEAAGEFVVDLRSRESVRVAAEKLKSIRIPEAAPESGTPMESFKVRLPNATATVGYKARPLNGIWATAPYLHNGSVPNLYELLKPAGERVKSFHVGSQEFDPVKVGYVDDPSQPLFNTHVDGTPVGGNSNMGHDFGTNLSPDERKDLLEYLKSL